MTNSTDTPTKSKMPIFFRALLLLGLQSNLENQMNGGTPPMHVYMHT